MENPIKWMLAKLSPVKQEAVVFRKSLAREKAAKSPKRNTTS